MERLPDEGPFVGKLKSTNGTTAGGSERHKPQMRYVVIPIEVWDLYKRKQITIRMLELLIIVDSLVNAKGEGCWASNNYLAKEMGISRMQVIRLINALVRMKLLKRVGVVKKFGQEHRVLETCWSRAIKPDSVQPDRG